MPAFTFRLELVDGSTADPPILHAAVPNWTTAGQLTTARAITLGS
jgi:hypothetical protein